MVKSWKKWIHLLPSLCGLVGMILVGCSSGSQSVKLGQEANELMKEKKFALAGDTYVKAAEAEKSNKKANQKLVAALLNRAGWAYHTGAKYEKAITYDIQTLEIQNQQSLFEEMESVLQRLGHSAAVLGRYSESTQYYLQAYGLQAQLGSYQELPPEKQAKYAYYSGNTLNNLAWYNLQPRGFYHHAIRYYQAAMTLVQPITGNEAALQVYQKNIQEAQKLLTQKGESTDYVVSSCSSMASTKEKEGGICTDYVGLLFVQLVESQGDEGRKTLEKSCKEFGQVVKICSPESRVGVCMLNAFTEKEALTYYYSAGGTIQWTLETAQEDCFKKTGAWWFPES